MRERRYWALVLLGLGTLGGYASGFQSLRHAGMYGQRHSTRHLERGSWLFGY